MTDKPCAPDSLGVCAYPPCVKPAVATLKRPFMRDDMRLCQEHYDRGVAMIAAVKRGEYGGHAHH